MPETPPQRPVSESRPAREPSTALSSSGRRRSRADDRALIRISSICDLIRIVPHQVGFTPTESLVIQCLEGTAATRVMRVDLPSEDESWQRELELLDMIAHLSAQLDPDRDQCLVVIYSHDAASTELAVHVQELVWLHGVSVLATAVVDGGEIRLIGPDGTVDEREPVIAPDSPGLIALKAANALNGRRVLADRAELAASVAAPEGIGRAVGGRAVASVAEELELDALRTGAVRPLAASLLAGALQDALETVDRDGTVAVGTAARLAVYCWNCVDRDAVLARMLDGRAADWIPVLVAALRRIPAEASADLCALLVVVAYRAGDGALAQVAADRVLRTEPRHRLTLLMLDIMFAGLPPDTLDGLCTPPT